MTSAGGAAALARVAIRGIRRSSMSRLTTAPLLLAPLLFAVAPGCRGCDERAPEHVVAAAASPASASASAPAASALTREEQRDLGARIPSELCEQAAKRVNVVAGRPETDKKGIEVLTRCLRLGNVAWYRCIVDASTPEDVRRCHSRFLTRAGDAPR